MVLSKAGSSQYPVVSFHSMVLTFHESMSTSRASSNSFHTEKITTIHGLRMKNRKYTYAISRVREHELNVLQMILAAMPAQ